MAKPSIKDRLDVGLFNLRSNPGSTLLNFFKRQPRKTPTKAAVDNRPEWQKLGYRNQQEYEADYLQAGYQSPAAFDEGYRPPVAPSQPRQSAPPVPASYGAPQGSSPAGGQLPVFSEPISAPGPAPEYYYFNGQVYDINNPDQRANFFAARNEAIRTQATRQVSDYETQLRQALAEAASMNAREAEGIDTDLTNLGKTEAEATRQYDQGTRDTNEGYDLGTVNRANYFAQLSPNAYQSSQGSSQQFANDKRLRALTDIDRARQETQGDINTNRAGLTRAKTDLGNQYNQYVSNTQGDLSRFSTDVNDYYNSQLDQLRTDFTNYDRGAGINQFRFGREQYNPVNVRTADIGQYTPYINFNQVQQSPEANFFKTQIPTTSNLAPRDQYLGYYPTSKDKDYISQYLTRGY